MCVVIDQLKLLSGVLKVVLKSWGLNFEGSARLELSQRSVEEMMPYEESSAMGMGQWVWAKLMDGILGKLY